MYLNNLGLLVKYIVFKNQNVFYSSFIKTKIIIVDEVLECIIALKNLKTESNSFITF